jgi:hypothetical protein
VVSSSQWRRLSLTTVLSLGLLAVVYACSGPEEIAVEAERDSGAEPGIELSGYVISGNERSQKTTWSLPLPDYAPPRCEDARGVPVIRISVPGRHRLELYPDGRLLITDLSAGGRPSETPESEPEPTISQRRLSKAEYLHLLQRAGDLGVFQKRGEIRSILPSDSVYSGQVELFRWVAGASPPLELHSLTWLNHFLLRRSPEPTQRRAFVKSTLEKTDRMEADEAETVRHLVAVSELYLSLTQLASADATEFYAPAGAPVFPWWSIRSASAPPRLLTRGRNRVAIRDPLGAVIGARPDDGRVDARGTTPSFTVAIQPVSDPYDPDGGHAYIDFGGVREKVLARNVLAASYSPDGRWLAFSAYDWRTVAWQDETADERTTGGLARRFRGQPALTLWVVPTRTFGPCLSPCRPRRLAELARVGDSPTRLEREVGRFSWSPASDRLAYVVVRNALKPIERLHVTDLTGSQHQLLFSSSPDSGRLSVPEWAPVTSAHDPGLIAIERSLMSRREHLVALQHKMREIHEPPPGQFEVWVIGVPAHASKEPPDPRRVAREPFLGWVDG